MNKSVTSALSGATDINSVIALVSSLERKETRLGRSSYVVTSKGAEVKTAFKVVDASSLIISNNLDGTINRKRKANAVCNTCSLQTKLELLLN